MAKARRKTVARSASVEKDIATAITKLEKACGDSDTAVTERTKIGKKLTTEVGRLRKRRTSLMKRKKTATQKAKEAPSAETRKALRIVEKDVHTTSKALAKARVDKAANSTELSALKSAQRQAKAYAKAIAQADRTLNKPKKRRRRTKKRSAEGAGPQ